MGNVALQLEAEIVPPDVSSNSNILFDRTTYQVGDISYNPTTGLVTLSKPGRYIVHWWLATQASLSQVGAAFGLVPSEGLMQLSNSPSKLGEVYGFGIIVVDDIATPVDFSLKNLSQQTFYFSQTALLKGGLIVVEDAEISAPAYGYVFNPLGETTWAAALDTALTFMQNGPLVNINHTPETSEIYVLETGDYEVHYTIAINSPIDAVLAIAINGTIMYSTAINTQLSVGEFSDSSILSLTAGDIVTLRLVSA